MTREEIIAFAAQYDPQPMHLDEAAGRKSLLGGLGIGLAWLRDHDAHDLRRFLLNSASMGAGGSTKSSGSSRSGRAIA